MLQKSMDAEPPDVRLPALELGCATYEAWQGCRTFLSLL